MTEDGRRINELMTQVLRLYRELQNLLVSADGLMTAKSWMTFNNVSITGSNSLDQPEQWIAQTVHRFYKNDAPEYSSILGYVSVLLMDSAKPDLLPQPLASAGWMDFGPDKKPTGWDYWYSRFHIWMPEATIDGHIRCVSADHWPKWKLPFVKVATLAVPLVEITSTNELNQRIVSPLLADIDTSA